MNSDQHDTSDDMNPIDPFFKVIREYEKSIDAKNPLSREQLIQLFPNFKERIEQYFRQRASLQLLQAESTKIDLCDTDRYKHIRPYVEGGMGAVFLAHDQYFDRQAVLKVPRVLSENDSKAMRRMEREALLSGHLQHPNILPIFEKGEIFTSDGRKLPFFAMRFLDGETLQSILDNRKHRDRDYMRYVLLFQQVCRAISYAHTQMVANLDLKPSNIMVGKYNDAYVIDWGLAIRLANRRNGLTTTTSSTQSNSAAYGNESNSEPTASKDSKKSEPTEPYFEIGSELTSIGGTEVYAPPELKQSSIEVDQLDFKRIDVFCLGGILCKIITGTTPYQRQDLTNLAPALNEIEQSHVSAELKQIALDCLAERPEARPVDAGEVERRITDFVVSQEQAKLRSERRVRNMILWIGLFLVGLTIALSYLSIRRSKVATQQAFFQSGLRSIAAGNLPEAEKQFTEGIKLGDAPLSFQIKLLRSTLSKQPRERAQQDIERLLDSHPSMEDRAELLLVLGDLKACDSKFKFEYRADLETALKLGVLSQADSSYAHALLSDELSDCQKHLEEALSIERFHSRAACLYSAVLLAAGKMEEASRASKLYLTVFPEDISLKLVSESCLALANSDYKVRSFETNFDQKLAALRRGFLPPTKKPDIAPTEQFAFARQGEVAVNAANFIRELPRANQTPGLPRAVFDSRSRYWREIASLAMKLGAPQSPLDLVNLAFNDREKLLSRMEVFSKGESDALPLQILASAKFGTLATNYHAWAKDSPELIQVANVEIDELQSSCLDRQTIAPRGPFELASRVVRFLANIQLAKLDESRADTANEKLQQDLSRLNELLLDYPEMLPTICSLILETYSSIESNYPPTQLDMAHRLRFASLWVTERPRDARAWLARAKMWEAINRNEDVIKDLNKCLEIDPKLIEAQKLLESTVSKVN